MKAPAPAAVDLQPRAPRYELIAAGVLFLAVSAWFLQASVASYFRQLDAHRNFAPVAAVVLDSKVTSRGSPSATRGTSFYPQVTYRYAVGTSEYQSDRYFFTGTGWVDQAAAQNVIAGWPKGAQIRAYFDPQNPAEAVLENSKPSARLFLLAIPLLAFGLLVVVLGVRGRRRRAA